MATEHKVGDTIKFDNGLVSGSATITKIVKRPMFEKINGQDTRYILDVNGHEQICSPSDVISDTAKEYTFDYKVIGFKSITVMASSLEEAEKLADVKINETDFGELENINTEVSDAY